MSERYLIVNADDFNTDAPRCRGILEGAARGIVTSTTALANLPWQEATAAELKTRFGAGVGVHLNLTKGRPLNAGASSLVSGDGEFFAKPRAWRRALRRRYDPREVEREFAAQIEKLLALGLVPSHIDGNNHIHVFPGIAPVVARLAVRYGIGRIRLPRERRWESSWRWVGKRRFIGLLSRRAQGFFTDAGLCAPDHFAGIGFPRPGQRDDLLRLLQVLPAGVTELMCHPGYGAATAPGSFSTLARESELAALTDPDVVRRVAEAGIRLISFADLPLAPK